jgi:hypothetical protein
MKETRMRRPIVRLVHGCASVLGLTLVGTFLLSTAAVEIAGDPVLVARVKSAIVSALWVLVPAMLVAAGSGQWLAGGSSAPLVRTKARRMRVAGANALLVLVPCALVLDGMAAAGRFDGTFAVVQGAEFAAGAGNLALLGLNMRDGLRMRARRLLRTTPAPGGPVGDVPA